MPVPKTSHLKSGTSVHIVLKADQGSGRLTTGQIADILTNHNHPRGIKVRLTDGQVGRVQSLADSDFSPSKSGSLAMSSSSNAGVVHRSPDQVLNMSTTPSTRRMVQDFRQDGHDLESREQSTSLFDYVRPPKQRKTAAKAQVRKFEDQKSPQVLLEAEFPKLDSALVAAILADYPSVVDARDVLKSLS
ncbi:MAG: hypothetical protein Q9218_003242 [Villophora microphyllina]